MIVVNHIGQGVTDLERSRTFYEAALGFEYWRTLELDDEPSNRLLGLTPPLGFTACYLRGGGIVPLPRLGLRLPCVCGGPDAGVHRSRARVVAALRA